MTVRTIAYLKSRFAAGDRPTQQDFWDLFETMLTLETWPATLPASSAANLTHLPIPDPLPAVSGEFLTNINRSDWVAISAVPTYATSTSFVVAGDFTGASYFVVGRRVRVHLNPSGYYFGTVTNAVYAAGPNTTTVTVDATIPTSALASVDVNLLVDSDIVITSLKPGSGAALTVYRKNAAGTNVEPWDVKAYVDAQDGNKQPLDATLTAMAGVATAADTGIYFTGVDAAAQFALTAAGRALVDDADAAAQRTTLGLGTAATQNIGSSGASVPLLNQTNTWGAEQVIKTNGGFTGFYIEAPAGNNRSLVFTSLPGGTPSSRWALQCTADAETGSNAGSNLTLFKFLDDGITAEATFSVRRSDGAVTLGAPTGGFVGGKGALNAQAVYDDNTLLTCYIIEAEVTGAVDLAKWDDLTPNTEIPVIDAVMKARAVPVLDGAGRPVRDKGQPVMREEVVEIAPAQPAQTIVRTHEPARRFAARAEMMLDPKQYGEFWRTNGHLPSMPSPAEWVDAGHKLSTGDLIQRLWEVVEVQSVHLEKLRLHMEKLQARIEALEAP